MVVGKNGVIIENVTTVQKSILGIDYIVAWDDDGTPIHIHKDVLTKVYEFHKPPIKTDTPQVYNNGYISDFLK